MAKVKVKLDVAAIKKWLLEHGEKLAFGFTMLVFLMFTWSAIRREVLESSKQPALLQQQAADVGTHVTKSPWNDEIAKTAAIEIIRYDERAKRERIVPATFPTPQALNPPLADPKTKRDVPELLVLEELKVASGFGTFSLQAEPAAGTPAGGRGGPTKLKGLPWVAITGLVPVQKQAREYSRVFDRAEGGNRDRDSVKYVGFKIERAEINDQDPAKLDWKPLARTPIVDQFQPQGLPEVVNPDCVDSKLTMPLRPLVGAAWGDAVSHPKIPLAVNRNAQAPTPPPVTEEAPKEAESKEADSGYQAAHAKSDQTVKPSAAVTDSAKSDDAELGYRLFRAFDFTVEPNKKYRYRIVVGLENPNFGVSRQYLKDPETANQKYMDTKPTEPSGVISVPDGYQVLAGTVKSSRTGEPAAKVMLVSIDKENGLEAAFELDVARGSVANTIAKEVDVKQPDSAKFEKMTDVKFRTDMVVLDMRGGKVVAQKTKLTSPGEVLLLDRNGDLIVRTELDDRAMYEKRTPPDEPETKAKRDPIPDTPKTKMPKKPKRP
jgi:hypothetical protein